MTTLASAIAIAVSGVGVPRQAPPPPLKPIDQTVEDQNPLSASLRDMQIDLRQPIGFQNVYRLPGQPGMLMRSSGALHAVFPNSTYVQSPIGPLAKIPAGTIFYIGLPPESAASVESDVDDLPPGSVRAGISLRHNSQLSSVVDNRIDLSIPDENDNSHPLDTADALLIEGRQVQHNAPDASALVGPTLANDLEYRQQRIAQLLHRAAQAHAARTASPTPSPTP